MREGIIGSAPDFPCFLKRPTNSFTALQILGGFSENFETLEEFFDTSRYFNSFICIFPFLLYVVQLIMFIGDQIDSSPLFVEAMI